MVVHENAERGARGWAVSESDNFSLSQFLTLTFPAQEAFD